MEVVQFSVKKHIIESESGNLVVVLAIMGMIAGLIAYWTGLSDKVDKEVRALGTTQSTTFIRADFKNTIKKSLQGKNTACTLSTIFRDKFKDFQATAAAAVLEKTYVDNSATVNVNEVATNPEIPCFLNINRYNSLKWDQLKISIRRTTDPNYMTLSNFIAADILAVFKVGGKPTVLKYQLRYRIDVLTMNHYGMIFTHSEAAPVFQLSDTSRLKINGPVLFDEANRLNKIPLNNLMVLPDTGQIVFTQEAYTTAPGFTSNADVITFLSSKVLMDVFKRGIQYGHLTSGAPAFVAPFEKNPSQWDELLDFKDIQNQGYPLPNTSPKKSIIFISPSTTVYEYTTGPNHSNTADIYNHMLGADSEKRLTSSCKIVDSASGPYHLMVHNNINQDFIIDFTKNIEEDFPPVFCGVIVAKNLIIKLNGKSATDPLFQHHLIGKFILKGHVQIENEGSLNIHDIMGFTEDLVDYAAMDLDIVNLRTQFYNQKYYSTQNFFLPFFVTYPTPDLDTESELMAAGNGDKYYFPRSTKTFFNIDCASSKKCRNPDIPTPTMEHLVQTHWQRLLFEVFDVE